MQYRITAHRGRPTQSALPKSINAPIDGNSLVRGVVLRVYGVDAERASASDALRLPEEGRQRALYCDVLTYSGQPRARSRVLYKCLVSSSRGGVTDDRIWVPRAARRSARTGTTVTTASVVSENPADLDGDHVLVGFMDQDPNLPVVLCGVPHPRSRRGPSAKNGDSEFYYHKGTQLGVDGLGNVLIDAASAHQDELGENLESLELPNTGSTGNVLLRARSGSDCQVVGTGGLLRFSPEGEVVLRGGRVRAGLLQFGDDGQLRLQSNSTQAGGDVSRFGIRPNGDIECVSRAPGAAAARAENPALGAVVITAQQVSVGAPDEPAVLGDALEDAVGDFSTSFRQSLQTLSTSASAAISAAQVGAAIAAFAASASQALTQLEQAVAGAKSTTVTLKR